MNTKRTIELQILECKRRLKELAPDIEFDKEKSKLYNQIIVQKAILTDKYKKICYKPSLIKRIKEVININPFKKKEKLISDYFL